MLTFDSPLYDIEMPEDALWPGRSQLESSESGSGAPGDWTQGPEIDDEDVLEATALAFSRR